jgi:hypothetical protein
VLTRPITVTVQGDILDEDNETFLVNLSAPSGAIINDSQGQGTITDDDLTSGLSINDVTVAEGNSGTTQAIFTVSLSETSSQTVSVNYSTADGSATAPGDYASDSGTLTFGSGVLTRPITVTVQGDILDENHETFRVNLSDPNGAILSRNQGQGTILDDDLAPDPPLIHIFLPLILKNAGTN